MQTNAIALRATNAEIEVRRADVQRLRFAGFTEAEIAKRVGTSVSTVCRDLDAISDECAKRIGDRFDLEREVGEAVTFFELLESAVMRELWRLENDGDGSTAKIVKCVKAAAAMRSHRVNLLTAVGAIRPLPERLHGLPTADEIRAALDAVERFPLDSEIPLSPADRPRPEPTRSFSRLFPTD